MSILGSLDVIVALELTGLVLNMFHTSIFLGHSPNICCTLEQIIQGYWTCIFLDLTGWVLIPTTNYVDLIVTIGTTNTFLFLLWQVFTKWPVLPQLVHVNFDLDVIVGITSLAFALTFGGYRVL